MTFQTRLGPKDRRARKQTRRTALLLAAAATIAAARQSFAANKTYNGPSGNWSTITWVPAGQPINGDTVTIGNGAGGVVTVTYDAAATANSLSQLTLDATSAGSVTLAQAQGSLTITGNEYAGSSGVGGLNLSGGTHSVTTGLYFGFNGGASGSGTLSGNGVLNTGFEEFVGYSGNGTFLQSGGTNTTLYLTTGYNASGNGFGTNVGSGTYTQTGGALNVTGGEYVGWYGNGIVNQSGGTNTANNLYLGFNTNGTNAAASGVYSMSNGASLLVNNQFFVGISGSGTFNQTGGNATASGGMTLAQNSGGTGTVNLSGGNLTVNGITTVALNGTGRFTQSGGVNVTTGLSIGDQSTGNGTYTLSGAGVLTVSNSTIIGNNGTGTFIQSGGTHNVNGPGLDNLYLGNGVTGVGTYTLSAGTLRVNNFEFVGYAGTGVMSQSSGLNTTGNLDIGYSNGAVGTYNLSGGTLSVASLEKVGLTGNGTFNQTGGNHTVGVGMHLGGVWTVTGTQRGTATYNMSAGSLTIGTPTGPGAEGFLGVGTHDDNGFFNQSGGIVAVTGKPGATFGNDGLYVGQDVGTTGIYNLSNGAQLNVSNDEFIGAGGIGIFNQSGGNHFVSGPNGIFLGVVNNGTNITSGAFNLSGGLAGAPNLCVGGGFPNGNTNIAITAVGYGNLNVTGGILNLGGSLQIFNSSNSAGVFSGMTLAGGTVNTPAIQAPAWDVVNFAGGTLNLTGGVSSNGGDLIIGSSGSVSATLNLNGGGLYVGAFEFIGYGVAGTFNQTGGVHSPTYVHIGEGAGVAGTYNLIGGVINDMGDMRVARFGIGAFVQSGGTNTISGNNVFNSYGLGIGDAPGSSGSYTLIAGVLSVSNDEFIGGSGFGTFSQTNGAHSVGGGSTGGSIYLGGNALGGSGAGTYFLSGGTLSVQDTEYVGYSGSGTFNQSGGVNTALAIELGTNSNGTSPASVGTYNLTGGTLSVGTEFIAVNGAGTFNQSGGSNTAVYLDVGRDRNPNTNLVNLGVLNISNGATVTMTGGSIGFLGQGIVNMTGGTFNIGVGPAGSPGIYLGFQPLASGTVNLSGGVINVLPNVGTYVGLYGAGVYNQSGGVNSSPYVFVGYGYSGTNPSSTGVYNLSGGTLVANIWEQIGRFGDGAFNQTGGSNTTNTLYLGDTDGVRTGSGTFTLSGTSTVFTSSNSEYVGYQGPGTFNQLGGTHNATVVNVGYGSNAIGTYNLSGGTLTAAQESIGYYGTGTFNQSGGSNSITWGTLQIGGIPGGGTGNYNLSGGTLTSAVVLNYANFTQTGGIFNGTVDNYLNFSYGGGTFNGAFIQLPGGTFNFIPFASSFQANFGIFLRGGTLNVPVNTTFSAGNPGLDIEGGTLAMAGGTFTGTSAILNNGLISGYGLISGSGGMTNNGAINVTGGNLAFAGSGPNISNGNITLAASRQLQLSAPLTNTGSILLGGGFITGTAALSNTTGSITGPGTISAPLANTGTLQCSGGALSITQPFTNAGLLTLSGPGASLNGNALTNNADLQGSGTVANAIVNNGAIEPLGGTLNFTGSLLNNAPGIIRVAANNKVLVTTGLATNFGTIDLAGGTFDNNNKPLFNQGQISGYGLLAIGGLTNASGRTITFTGGFTSVNGDVANSAGATLRAALSPVLFTGNVVNNGVIKVTGAPTNIVTITGAYSGSGAYLSDPADNYFLSDVNVSAGGLVSGAVGDRFFIAGTYVNAGTYSNNGGTLAGQNVINEGSFNQLAGNATILALSGAGATTVGGGAGTAIVSVYSLSQGSVTINSGGTLTIRPAGSRLTNTATNLQLNGTGTLDISNHELLTSTAPATIESYLANAYDPNGNADWGQHGLTSSVAKSNPTSYSVGYAYGSDPSAQDAGVTTKSGTPLAAGQTIIRPVLTGDANMDGAVDFFDITQILGYKYNTGQTASYTDGDLDYSGKVDFFDIVLLLSANYNSGQMYLGAHAAAPTLSSAAGASSRLSSSPSATTIGTTADGKPDFEYDPATGHLRFRTDGGVFTTTGGSPSFVSSLTISSAGGILISGGASGVFANGTGATLTTTLMSSALTNSPGFSDGFDIGIVLAPGLSPSTLTADLTVKYQSLNGGSLKTADITVPEPVGLAILTLAPAAALTRRRRRWRAGRLGTNRDALTPPVHCD
jgi:hypothetical protein